MGRSQPRGAGRPRIALCTIAFRERLLDDALDMARDLRFPAVELWGREPHVSEVYDYNRLRMIRKMCQERGLEIAALGSYLRFGATKKNSDNVSLVQTIQTAYTLRAPILRVWASDVGSSRASESVFKRAVAEAQEACRRCLKLGITLAVEMHDDTLADTAASALKFVEMVGCENLGLNFQPSARVRREKPLERLEKVIDHVVHCHAQNFYSLGTADGVEPKRAPLREGLVDYKEVVALLKSANYQGWIAVEFAHTEGNEKNQAIAEDLVYLTELLR
ncbi:MAG: sugar phosphate isomerase/epimerase [Armatimonadetes bacterium]|nr:sugar phosphate isomerase/epimerase [Armatimonadota bacterium]